jgi:hypothetical protein
MRAILHSCQSMPPHLVHIKRNKRTCVIESSCQQYYSVCVGRCVLCFWRRLPRERRMRRHHRSPPPFVTFRARANKRKRPMRYRSRLEISTVQFLRLNIQTSICPALFPLDLARQFVFGDRYRLIITKVLLLAPCYFHIRICNILYTIGHCAI